MERGSDTRGKDSCKVARDRKDEAVVVEAKMNLLAFNVTYPTSYMVLLRSRIDIVLHLVSTNFEPALLVEGNILG